MPLKQKNVDDTLTSINNTIKSYDQVDRAAASAAQTFSNVKQTQIGAKTNEVVGGVQSLTSDTSVLGKTNFNNPTEGLLTEAAVPGAVNNSLNTDISSLSSAIGTKVTINYTDSGSVDSITTSSNSTGSVASILSNITGLGQKPGFLKSIISSSNAKGLTSSLGGLTGTVGAFSNVAAVNGVSTRTQSIIADVVSNATTDGSSTSSSYLTAFSDEGTNAIADVSNMITGGTTVSIPDVIADVTGVRDPNLLPQVREYKNTRAEVVNQTNQFQSDLSNFVPLNNKLGFIQNLVQKIEPKSVAAVMVRNNIKLSPEDIANVAYLSQGTPNEQEEAIQFVQKKSGKSPAEVRSFLLDLDTTIAGTVVIDTTNVEFSNPFKVGGTDGSWNNGVGAKDFVFSFVSSVEELEAEFKSISREITEMVVHWTETYTNTNIGSEEINNNHIELGLSGIGYHYVIRRDGSLQRGRPSGSKGQHATANNHDERSIAVVFVGGLNCPTGTPNPLEYKSVSSLTLSQFSTFKEMCKAFFKSYPGGQILGHNDIDSTEDDPGFDVRDYCEDLFGKISKFTDPLTQPPFTSDEINS